MEHSPPYSILYVDDEAANLETFRRAFSMDFRVKTALGAKQALQILADEDFSIVIADQRMPGLSGVELCEKLIQIKPQTLRMILTAYTEPQILLEAIQRGHVHDYIVKPWRKSELKPILEKALEQHRQQIEKWGALEKKAQEAEELRQEIEAIYDFKNLIGFNSSLRALTEDLKRVSPTDSTVLILGETGTGKELIARAIHANSKRKEKPFVAVHCAALSETVLESELFGHEKGAFTGANELHLGRFERAEGGTLFLDEIAEIPLNIQVKLLRVLQEREIERVGGKRPIPINVRVIAATHQNLMEKVHKGSFRQDLFYRLNVIPLKIPPLRERKEDLILLAEYFLQKFCKQMGRDLKFSSSSLEALGRYDWPGNVRELQNIIERAVIIGPGPILEANDLNLNLEEFTRIEHISLERIAEPSSVRAQIQEEERLSLTQALKAAQGNISEAARILGIARSTLFHRLKKHDLI